MQAKTAQHVSLGERGEDFFLDIPSHRTHRNRRQAKPNQVALESTGDKELLWLIGMAPLAATTSE